MALGKNVERLRKAKNMTLRAVAIAACTDPQAIKALEIRDSSSSKYAPALAKLFGVSIEDLMKEDFDPDVEPNHYPAADLPLIPVDPIETPPPHEIAVWEVARNMGYTLRSPVDSHVVNHINVPAERIFSHSFSSLDNLRFMAAFGDSMEPTFRDGDALVVDTGETEVKTDAIYVILIAGILFVKRFQRRPDGDILMISDNKKYEPHVLKNDAPQPFKVMGRIVLAFDWQSWAAL